MKIAFKIIGIIILINMFPLLIPICLLLDFIKNHINIYVTLLSMIPIFIIYFSILVFSFVLIEGD